LGVFGLVGGTDVVRNTATATKVATKTSPKQPATTGKTFRLQLFLCVIKQIICSNDIKTKLNHTNLFADNRLFFSVVWV